MNAFINPFQAGYYYENLHTINFQFILTATSNQETFFQEANASELLETLEKMFPHYNDDLQPHTGV